MAFTGLEVHRCRFIECSFVRCDLSVLKPIDTEFAGCAFEDCRLTGVAWGTGRWPKDPLHDPNRFAGCDLSYADFSGLDLAGLVLSSCRLRETGFRNARLVGADFTGSDCTGADFAGADLSDARLAGATGVVLDPRTTRLSGTVLDAAGARRILDVLGIEIE